MAGQADGTVYVDTNLDPQGFAAGSKELRQAIKSLNSKVETLGSTMKNAVSGSVNAIAQFNSKAETLGETIAQDEEKLKALGEKRLPTDDYTRICAEAEKAGQALEKLLTKQERWEESGKKQSGIGWTTLQSDLNRASALYDRLIARKKELEQTGQAYQMGSNTAEYAQLASNLEAAKQRLAEMQSEIDAVSQKMNQPITLSGRIKNAFTSVGATIKSAFGSIGNAVTHPLQTIGGALGTVVTKAGQAAPALAKMAGSAISNGLKKITSRVKQAASSLLGLNKSASKASGGLSGGLKTILKYGLGIRSLYILVNKLRSALVAGFQNLAQYSNSTNTAISSLQTSLTTLKNSFAAAFAPILTTVAPILTRLINLLATAISYVGAFFAALTGSKTYTKAIAVQEDYAASLSGTADAASDAAGAAEEAKRQLASFDELNVLSDSSSGGGSGGGGGGGGSSPMFEESEMPSGVADFVENMKELFANGEYEEIGHLIADGLNSAMQFVDDWINNTFRPMGVKWAKIVARVLNGLVDGLDWTLLGKTIADGINAVFDIVNTFLTTFDFVSFGKGIGEGLAGAVKNLDTESIGSVLAYKVKGLLETAAGMVNGFSDSGGWAAIGEKLAGYVNGWFETIWSIDWASVGESIGNLITGIPETIISYLQNVDWKGHAEGLSSSIIDLCSGLAEKFENYDWKTMAGELVTSIVTAITDFFGNIDWGGVASSAAEMIGAFIRGVALAVVGLGETLWNDYILPAWSSVVDWWYDTAYEDGSFTIQGLLGGILEALIGAVANIGEWIFTYIVDPFVSALIGEDTWSGIKDAGKNIIEGLYNGITEFFSDPMGWIKEHIFQPFINGFKSLFGISSPSTVMEEQGGFLVDGLLQGITNVWGNITEFFSGALEGLKETLSGAWDSIKETASTAWENVKSTISDTWDGITSNVSSAYETVKDGVSGAWKKVKSTTSTLWDKAKGAVSSAWDSITSTTSSESDDVKKTTSSAWNSVKTSIKTSLSDATSGVSSNLGSIKSTVSSVNGNVESITSSAWNNVESSIKTSLSDAASSSSSNWGGMESTVSTVNNNMKNTISNTWGDIKSTMTGQLSTLSTSCSSTFKNLKSSATSWGSDICSNLASGIKNAMGKVTSACSTLAGKIKSLLGFSEPEEGPLSDFHTYMPDMIDLMAKGIKDNQDTAIDAVSGMASAISEEMQNGSYTLGNLNSQVDYTLSSFADKVQDSFSSMLDKLQAIAESVTFTTPAVATGVVPYKAATTAASGGTADIGTTIEASNDELASVVTQVVMNAASSIVTAIRNYSGTTVNLDKTSMAEAVIQEINRRTRMTNSSPLIG